MKSKAMDEIFRANKRGELVAAEPNNSRAYHSSIVKITQRPGASQAQGSAHHPSSVIGTRSSFPRPHHVVSEPLGGLGFDDLHLGSRIPSTIKQSSMYSYRKHEDKAKQPATKKLLQGRRKEIQIPLFYGEFDPDTYLEWEKDVDFVFNFHNHTEEKKLYLATTGLRGYALDWWYQIANNRKRNGEFQISSWYEMKSIMKKRFVAKRYGQIDLEWLKSQSRSATEHVGTSRHEPKTYYGREAQRKSQLLQTHLGYIDYLQSTQFKENLRDMVDQSLTAVVQNQPKRSVPRPASGVDELRYYQSKPAEKKEEIAAKPAEKEQEIQSKQEESLLAMCGHEIDLIKAKERELDEALVVHKESLETLIEQGGFIRSFSCDLLIQPFVCIQFNLVEHLRFVKGLQHFVFEPGGEAQGLTTIENVLVQKATATHDPVILKEQDLRLNPFEGGEGSTIQISSKFELYVIIKDLRAWSNHPRPRNQLIHVHIGSRKYLDKPAATVQQEASRDVTAKNRFFTSHAGLRWLVRECGKTRDDPREARNGPRLKSEYGDHCTRPPDQENHFRQFTLILDRVVLRGDQNLLIFGHMGLVRPPELERGFLDCHDELTLLLEMSCVLKIFTAVQRYEGEDEYVLIILEGSDLRTNPFKGGGDGAIQTSLNLRELMINKESARSWISAQPDRLIGRVHGLIQEILSIEEIRFTHGETFTTLGWTLDNHGRPVRTIIDKEMDGTRLVGQEMEWAIQCDREMDWSNRHGREMSWKWKMKNQGWKWNMRIIFIIQMSIRSNLVGPGTRWIEPKKELFEKGLYRPKKWKDKPAWFMIGP